MEKLITDKLVQLEELVKTEAEEFLPVLEKIKNIVELSDLSKASPDDEDQQDDSGFDDEDDDAAQWLAQHGGGAKVKEDKKDDKKTPKKRVMGAEWAPRSDYSDKEQAAIKEFMDQGYSHREAERMAGAHQGPMDLWSAMSHSLRPSQPSDKMLAELKELAGHWIKNSDKQARLRAEPEKNPIKYAAGKLGQAHEDKMKDYHEAYHTYLQNPALKHLSARERHAAIRDWKNNWKSQAKGHSDNLAHVSGEQRHFSSAAEARNQALQEKLAHIFSGGLSGGDMDSFEAAQHLGVSTSEEDAAPNVTTFKDPSADFAARNQEFIEMQNQKRAANKPVAPAPAAPPPQAAAPPAKPNPGFIVRKRANPEQLDRFNRVNAAKMAMKTTAPEDEGGEE